MVNLVSFYSLFKSKAKPIFNPFAFLCFCDKNIKKIVDKNFVNYHIKNFVLKYLYISARRDLQDDVKIEIKNENLS